jgi:ATP-dependent Lon protease
VLPLRDIVVFPHMIVALFVGRKKSIRALDEVMRSDTFIMLATQKNASDDDPATQAIYEVGTLASVLQLLKLPDGTVKVLVEGAQRARVLKYTDRSEYYEAEAVVLGDTTGERIEAEALARSITTEFESYVKLNKKLSPEVVGVVRQIEDYGKLADTIASHLAVKIPDRQAILEITTITGRLEKVFGVLENEISVLQVEKRIRTRVKRQMEKTQREYFLNEQMKAIQNEIGGEEGKDEFTEIEDKIKKIKLSKEAREKAKHELKKLRQISPARHTGSESQQTQPSTNLSAATNGSQAGLPRRSTVICCRSTRISASSVARGRNRSTTRLKISLMRSNIWHSVVRFPAPSNRVQLTTGTMG